MRFWFGYHGFVFEFDVLDKVVHIASINLSGGGLIDKEDSYAIVVCLSRAFFLLKKCTAKIRKRHSANPYTVCSFY